MNFYQDSVQEIINRYSLLYVYIGEIELTLRRKIPEILNQAAHEKSMEDWTDLLTFDLVSRNALSNAGKPRSGQNVADLLPLSFWTNLFSRGNFQRLWVHNLSGLFPNLRNPQSKDSYRRINNLIFDLRIIRNQVAHYNYQNFANYTQQKERLLTIRVLLGILSN